MNKNEVSEIRFGKGVAFLSSSCGVIWTPFLMRFRGGLLHPDGMWSQQALLWSVGATGGELLKNPTEPRATNSQYLIGKLYTPTGTNICTCEHTGTQKLSLHLYKALTVVLFSVQSN